MKEKNRQKRLRLLAEAKKKPAVFTVYIILRLSGFMISSALEFFLTVFAGLWLWLFCRRIRILKRHWL